MSFEYVSGAVGILVVAAGIFAHSINLQNKVDDIDESYGLQSKAVTSLSKEVITLREKSDMLESLLSEKNEDIRELRESVRSTNESLIDSITHFRDVLIEMKDE